MQATLKSDEDIKKEFEGFKVFSHEVQGKRGYLELYFPNGDESVGGGLLGGGITVENYFVYEDGSVGFSNWYPREVREQLKTIIKTKLNK